MFDGIGLSFAVSFQSISWKIAGGASTVHRGIARKISVEKLNECLATQGTDW